MMKWLTLMMAVILLSGVGALAQATKPADIDWPKAQTLYQKSQRGEALTADEQAYLDRAKAEMAAGRGPGHGPGGPGGAGGPGGPASRPGAAAMAAVPPPHDHLDLLPLNQMTAKDSYKGEDGGLYGAGQNAPPPAQLKAAKEASAKIQPLDKDGKPAATGKIVLMSVGMSNTSAEFERFKAIADALPNKNPALVVINGAQGSMTAPMWAKADSMVWGEAQKKLQAGGVTDKQVEAIWLKQAIGGPAQFGDFPASAQQLRDYLTDDIQQVLLHYPNVRIIYFSSRIYGGNATVSLNPEPYAYESAFAVRWVIQDQIKGEAKLNFDPAKGEVKAPVLLWGPYLWADGTTPRKSDGLVWKPSEFSAGDGTHPNMAAADKVAHLLLDFFKTDPVAKTWFVKSGR